MEQKADIKIAVDPVSAMACARCGAQIDCASQESFSRLLCPSCGAEQVVPARFGPFLLLSLINTGGMGCVYLARDESLGRLVAIKVMRSSLGEDATFIESFRREAQAAAKLNHPNIAQIYSCGQEHNQPYIVMELVSGQRFDKLIAEDKKLDPAFVLKIGIDIAEGLKAADEIGLVHGDIKPENILLDEKMNAKLVDFGIATFAAEKDGPEGVWGTPYYIAPEKIRRQKVDARADIYSLGATLYHALAGRPPFDGPTPADVVRARLEKSAKPLCRIRPEIGAPIERIVSRMLEEQPARRHPTYASLLGDLRGALEALGPQAGSLAGPRTRRVMIMKKGGAPALPPDNANADKTPDAGGSTGSGRLVIRKRTVGRVSIKQDNETAPGATAPAAPAKRGGGGRKTLLTVVLLILLAAGFTGGMMCRSRQQVVEAARQAVRRQEMLHREQVEKAEAVCKRVQAGAADLVRAAIALRPHMENAGRMALSIFGQTLEDLERSLEPAPAAAPDATGAALADDARLKQELAETLVRMSRDSRQLADKNRFARELEDAAAEALKSAKETTNTEAAAEHVLVLDEYSKAVQPLKEQARAIVDSAGKALKSAQDLKVGVDRALAANKQAEERRKKEEAHKALVATESARVAEIRASCKPMLEGMNFMAALGAVSNQTARLETREAIDLGRQLAERIRLLLELKTFLIDSISAKPYPWGWHRGGSVYEDIVGADAGAIKLRSGPLPWSRMSTPQLTRTIEHYLKTLSVRSAAAARLYLATAIWMDEIADAASASAYVAKAVAASPIIQRDVDRLLPPKPEAAPPAEAAPAAESAPAAGEATAEGQGQDGK